MTAETAQPRPSPAKPRHQQMRKATMRSTLLKISSAARHLRSSASSNGGLPMSADCHGAFGLAHGGRPSTGDARH